MIQQGLLASYKANSGSIPTTGLRAEYLFLGNANDTSGNGYNFTVSGATLTTGRDSVSNSAYSFANNGSNRVYGSSSQVANIFNSTALTINLWFYKTSSWTNNNYFFSCDAGANQFIYWRYGNPNGVLHFDYGNGGIGSQLTHTTTNPSLNTWHMATATLSGTSLKLYIDGVADGTGSTNQSCGAFSANNGLAWGAYWSGSSSFGGVLDDCRIWNVELTASEIADIYSLG